MWIKLLVSSAISGLAYRLGGIGRPFNTKVRDFGVPSLMLVTMYLLGLWNWWLILCFFLMFGAITTYTYGLPKPNGNVQWYHWFLHGFFVSLAMLPYAYATGCWGMFWLRCGLTAILICSSSEAIGWDDLEEGSRGFIFNITLGLFLL